MNMQSDLPFQDVSHFKSVNVLCVSGDLNSEHVEYLPQVSPPNDLPFQDVPQE